MTCNVQYACICLYEKNLYARGTRYTVQILLLLSSSFLEARVDAAWQQSSLFGARKPPYTNS